jgi:hypothetical protein
MAPDTFTTRLGVPAGRRGVSNADPGMVVQPYVDPGYAMPNADEGNLNQSMQARLEVGGVQPVAFSPGPGVNAFSPQLLMLLQQRPELLQHFMRQNRLL